MEWSYTVRLPLGWSYTVRLSFKIADMKPVPSKANKAMNLIRISLFKILLEFSLSPAKKKKIIIIITEATYRIAIV